jgi:response regulator of citrate/malate metabolism
VANGKQYRQMREMLNDTRTFNQQLIDTIVTTATQIKEPANESYNLFDGKRTDADEAAINQLRE